MPQGSDPTPGEGADVGADGTDTASDVGQWQVPGQPEREKLAPPPAEGLPGPGRRTKRRRAVRSGTNPSAEDLPDVVPPREEPAPGESAHERWLREQRPPHWE
ncbi:hypothetical protein GCM10023153_11530 [Ornithinibacter aureus]|uniref:Uncharacterized protein n=1 Tax=Ornithinibacter aureus TaxID=622664 RepID=A0ABP8JLB4_9MICO